MKRISMSTDPAVPVQSEMDHGTGMHRSPLTGHGEAYNSQSGQAHCDVHQVLRGAGCREDGAQQTLRCAPEAANHARHNSHAAWVYEPFARARDAHVHASHGCTRMFCSACALVTHTLHMCTHCMHAHHLAQFAHACIGCARYAYACDCTLRICT
eukprot:4753899-Pleurochrysis_carterae.AAC.2